MRDERKQQEVEEGDDRKTAEVVGWKARVGRWSGGGLGLMCPSWGEAGQEWLSVELN